MIAAVEGDPLTERELEVLALVGAGLSDKGIAERLAISLCMAKVHVSRIYSKLGFGRMQHTNNRALAVRIFFLLGPPTGRPKMRHEMSRLANLQPQFIRYETKGDREVYVHVHRIEEAQGIRFQCPVCANGHCLAVTFANRGVPDNFGSHDKDGKPSRWMVSGSDYQNLTLQPSIDIGCWHGWVTDGEAK